jgi:AcrR family transcriptional regulator
MYDNTRVTPTRRDEHVADTRQALVDAARTLFTEQGFAATGTEEIVAAARVTRGALYYHFHDKADLFRAVMEQIAREVAEHLIDAELSRPPAPGPGPGSGPGPGPGPGSGSGSGPGPSPAGAWDEVRDGLRAFLDLCVVTDDFQRIVLVEGPAVLGHEAWDELVARHGSNLLAQWLSRAVEQGRIAPLPIQPLTRLLIAMISESSLYIARADDRSAARVAMGTVLDRFLNGLETSPQR